MHTQGIESCLTTEEQKTQIRWLSKLSWITSSERTTLHQSSAVARPLLVGHSF